MYLKYLFKAFHILMFINEYQNVELLNITIHEDIDMHDLLNTC